MSELELPGFPLRGSPEWQVWTQWIGHIAMIGPVPLGKYVSHDALERMCRRMGAAEAVDGWWNAIVAFRAGRELALRDETGMAFKLPVDSYRSLASQLGAAQFAPEFRGEDLFSRPAAVPEIIRETTLREEAVASCVLDGLPVDRQHAMEMLESGREPRDRSETAVRQTYLALRYHLPTQESLSVDGILQLHRLVTEESSESPDTPGRLRRDGEAPNTYGAAPADVPAPPATELEHRLSELLRFIQPDGPDFLYDTVRAAVTQFWIAYERPFVEGNGRLARVLFYALLQDRYHPHPAGLVSISSRWMRAPRAYADAFRNARTDHDVGYFVHGQLRILNRAVQRLLETISGVRETGAKLREQLPGVELNERQIELLARARNHPDRRLTIDSHRRRSRVVYQTARTDLLRLAELELLAQEKEGRAFVFRATGRLATLLDV